MIKRKTLSDLQAELTALQNELAVILTFLETERYPEYLKVYRERIQRLEARAEDIREDDLERQMLELNEKYAHRQLSYAEHSQAMDALATKSNRHWARRWEKPESYSF